MDFLSFGGENYGKSRYGYLRYTARSAGVALAGSCSLLMPAGWPQACHSHGPIVLDKNLCKGLVVSHSLVTVEIFLASSVEVLCSISVVNIDKNAYPSHSHDRGGY